MSYGGLVAVVSEVYMKICLDGTLPCNTHLHSYDITNDGTLRHNPFQCGNYLLWRAHIKIELGVELDKRVTRMLIPDN